MTTFETMIQVENQITQLDRARAVLSEVENYFDFTDERKWLPRYAEHILILLHVVSGLLYDMSPELTAIVDELLAHHKAEKEVKAA